MLGDNLVGNSAVFRKLLVTADQFAKHEHPVLILGETGVGKELLAQRIHAQSSRSARPIVAINCGAIPPALFESELFGYERGAFSGAARSSVGLIRHASGGTLFLDEVGELEPVAQSKLLRFLDCGEVRALGSAKIERVSVRILSATNVDLDQAAADGRFRKDLLERLGVLTLNIPSLRSRQQDIVLIATHVAHQLNVRIQPPELDLLSGYRWPGNVRQLRNFLIRAAILSPLEINTTIVRQMLDEERGREKIASTNQMPLQGPLAEIEKRVIVERLHRYGGNRKQTARELGIAKSTLHEKLKRWKDEVDVGHGSYSASSL